MNPEITHRDLNEVREKIACALAANCNSIEIDRCGFSPSRLTIRCTGRAAAARKFFAKIYLTKDYPVPQRFRAPWEDGETGTIQSRPVWDQIETEWEMTYKMRALSPGRAAPAPLGKSRQARVIVWEEAGGIRLDRLAERSWRTVGWAESVARALFQAGQWLRGLHDGSAQGDELLDLEAGIRRLKIALSESEGAARRYTSVALEILEGLMERLGGCAARMPVAFAHGDFCLANLLWEDKTSRLAVVDFELAGFRPAYFDLFALISSLRALMLNPFMPKRLIKTWELSFWRGYGEISPQLSLIVRSLALARIYSHHLPRLLTRGKRRGRLAGITAWCYRAFVERLITASRFGPRSELEWFDLQHRRDRSCGAEWTAPNTI